MHAGDLRDTESALESAAPAETEADGHMEFVVNGAGEEDGDGNGNAVGPEEVAAAAADEEIEDSNMTEIIVVKGEDDDQDGSGDGKEAEAVMEEVSPAKTNASDAPGIIIDEDGMEKEVEDARSDIALDTSDLEGASDAATMADTEVDDVMEVIAMSGTNQGGSGNGITMRELEAILLGKTSPARTEIDDDTETVDVKSFTDVNDSETIDVESVTVTDAPETVHVKSVTISDASKTVDDADASETVDVTSLTVADAAETIDLKSVTGADAPEIVDMKNADAPETVKVKNATGPDARHPEPVVLAPRVVEPMAEKPPGEVVINLNCRERDDIGIPNGIGIGYGIAHLQGFSLRAEEEIEAPPSARMSAKENGGDRPNVRGDADGNGVALRDLKLDIETKDNEEEEDEENVKPWKPWAVVAIVLASIVVFGFEMYANNCPGTGPLPRRCFAGFLGRFSFQPLRQNPLLGPSSSTLVNLGALEWNKLIQHDEVWRLVSNVWLHAGVLHLLFNMAFLVLLGVKLEQRFGFARFALIYVLSGCASSILSALLLRDFVTVGSSASLFGVFGAVFSELITNLSIYSIKSPVLCALLAVVVANLVVGIFPHVNNLGNIGGFVAGFLLGFVLLMRPRLLRTVKGEQAKPKYSSRQYVFCTISALLLVILFTAALVTIYVEDSVKGCTWCHYLICVPSPFWSCAS